MKQLKINFLKLTPMKSSIDHFENVFLGLNVTELQGRDDPAIKVTAHAKDRFTRMLFVVAHFANFQGYEKIMLNRHADLFSTESNLGTIQV